MSTHAGPWLAGERFPATRRSVVLAARDADPEVRRRAWDVLTRSYWKPVYKLLRTRWRLDREAALKVVQMSGGAGEDDETVERLLREACILARLEHPGIVPVHDAGRLPDGRVYYAMKRVRGLRLDGLTALISAPQTRPQIIGIVIGSMIKGLIAGILIGWFSRKVKSLPLGIVFGLAVGALLAFIVVYLQHFLYFWEVILPGSAVGVIVGYATQRHAEASLAKTAA